LNIIAALQAVKQGVALTGRNRTGPSWSVGRPTAHAPGSVTDDRRQTATTTDTSDRYNV